MSIHQHSMYRADSDNMGPIGMLWEVSGCVQYHDLCRNWCTLTRFWGVLEVIFGRILYATITLTSSARSNQFGDETAHHGEVGRCVVCQIWIRIGVWVTRWGRCWHEWSKWIYMSVMCPRVVEDVDAFGMSVSSTSRGGE